MYSRCHGFQDSHPSAIVLERLSDTLLYRTDEHGTARISTDGERLWVEPQRTP